VLADLFVVHEIPATPWCLWALSMSFSGDVGRRQQ